MQAHSLSLWALQLNFTASSLPIFSSLMPVLSVPCSEYVSALPPFSPTSTTALVSLSPFPSSWSPSENWMAQLHTDELGPSLPGSCCFSRTHTRGFLTLAHPWEGPAEE